MACGYITGRFQDASRQNWQDTGARPIAWAAWYPTDAISGASPPGRAVFDPGDVIWDADLRSGGTYPVVLMSHGTGGTAESLGWMARALVDAGCIVLAANHHGNTGIEPYHPAGFLCWWERALDLNVLLSTMAEAGRFSTQLDLTRVAALGFSLGAYTALALAGARTEMDRFLAWRAESGLTMRGPIEMPDAEDHLPALTAGSTPFQASWARQGSDFANHLVRAVVAIAPPPPVRAFVPTTVAGITVPVVLMSAGGDREAPPSACADWLAAQNGRFAHHRMGGSVGHYTFVGAPSDKGLVGTAEIFTDPDGVDRAAVQASAIEHVQAALAHEFRQF